MLSKIQIPRRITKTRDDHINDGRPHHAQLSYYLAQLPAFLRHIPSYAHRSKVQHVNPKKHYVWLFDNIAFRASSVNDEELSASTSSTDACLDSSNTVRQMMNSQGSDPWRVEYTAAFFKRSGGKELAAALARVCHDLEVEENAPCQERARYRIQHFVDSALPRHVIHTSTNGQGRHLHGPASSSGISTTFSTLHTDSHLTHSVLNTFPGARSATCFIPGITRFAEPTGFGVISDIDDTIKLTQTTSPLGALSTTFIETPTPITGMPELYAHLNTLLREPTTFYLSASPHVLYPTVRSFRDAHFPFGPIILRETSLHDPAGILAVLTEDVMDYKLERTAKIRAMFPHRRFVLLGDSTQKDPETYAEVARRYGNWILAIFIRRVRGISELASPGLEDKNADERFDKAFEGLDPWKWYVFDEPQEVNATLSQLLDEGVAFA